MILKDEAMQNVISEVRGRKSIWQCATPKSASTYLHHILTALWSDDCIHGSPVPYFGDRMQEPDILTIFRYIQDNQKPYFSGHLHQRYTTYLNKFFIKKQDALCGGVIVQSRDLKDTIVSLKDHLEKDYTAKKSIRNPWFVSIEGLWQTLSDDQKYKLVTSFYAYWHIDFLNSWLNYPRALHVSYAQVTEDTVNTVNMICKYFEIEKTTKQIEEAVLTVDGYPKESKLLNVGQSGRGKTLIPTPIQSLIEELESLTKINR